ncbi:MAG: aldo/keto reductase [Lachnospiraceae bacterium]|nr:aldo/keto reductase [Lachnospiraceae bacterium]
MKQIKTRSENLTIPAIGLGCMRIAGLREKKAIEELIAGAMESGINFFDHADIYAGGESERMFGECAGAFPREKMILQTKCGIRPRTCYDFSGEHIISSVEESLRRLKTEYVDILLLHRPDTLMEPEEVAEAFETLKNAGKVRHFGVSNMNPGQIELLEQAVPGGILFDQVQFSLAHSNIIDSGINFNTGTDAGIVRDGGLLEYARLKKITLQAWSPFQYGMFEGTFIGSEKYPKLNAVLDKMAEKYGITSNALAVAWIMRHPANIQTIVGSTNISRIRDISRAAGITLSREDWYRLYMAAGNRLP